ncbi:carboxypeptidase regulatory-like domain-containing protein, partial [candidate division WOR-3 bacterium]|nr:carboxypeptidase regulatory-like domain-containing protein [candidate division WOR-3 bacterium]
MLVLAGLAGLACAPALRFQARITDGETGRPLVGAVVTVEETGMMAATDSTGATPAVRAEANAVLAVACPGYLPTSTSVELPARRGDTVRTAILLYPDRPRTLVGRVTSAGTGFPLPNAAVSVLGTQFVAVTGPGGNYRFEGFPPGPRLVRAGREGWLADSARVLALGGDTTRVHFRLRDTTDEGRATG